MPISPLAKYVALSPNNSGRRNHKIDIVTIHCMVGHMSAKACVDMYMNPNIETSCNYAVGDNPGDIACGVDENNRAWTTSSPDNDHRAITIEVASDRNAPYAITDTAMENLITLLVDICKRNNIDALRWKADSGLKCYHPELQNMTAHRWFAAKACPGDYIYSREGWIADEVNKRLGKPTTNVVNTAKVNSKKEVDDMYKVQVGAFTKKENAVKLQAELKAKGYDAIIVNTEETLSSKSVIEIAREVIDGKWGNGEDRKKKLKTAGYDPSEIQDEVNRLLGG